MQYGIVAYENKTMLTYCDLASKNEFTVPIKKTKFLEGLLAIMAEPELMEHDHGPVRFTKTPTHINVEHGGASFAIHWHHVGGLS